MAQKQDKPLLVLLPGFDGTGRLYSPLVRALSGVAETQVVSYPADTLLGYAELGHEASRELPNKPFVLVAESFGGPVALHIASKGHPHLRGLVLSASFISNPRPLLSFLFDFLIGPGLFRIAAPRWFLRHFLVGRNAERALIEATLSAVRSVSPEVLAYRLGEIGRVDATKDLAECPVPLLYLQATGDKLVAPKVLNMMRRVRPDLEARNIQGPHLLLQAAPEPCAEEILQFARKVV